MVTLFLAELELQMSYRAVRHSNGQEIIRRANGDEVSRRQNSVWYAYYFFPEVLFPRSSFFHVLFHETAPSRAQVEIAAPALHGEALCYKWQVDER
eukprot:7092522-Pyramimonas_sp.AAC.1